MGRPNLGGHIRRLGGSTKYRLIRVMIDGKSKQVLQHRHIMEQHLGRPLTKHEIVHHRDENGLNNRIDNLQIMSAKDHQHEHLMGTRKWPVEEGIKLRQAGWTLQMIADEYGVSMTSVRKAFKVRQVDTKDLRHGTNKWDYDRGVKMFELGLSIKQIALSVGVSAPSVRKAFVKSGLI